jgi:type IV pilus secretin PilQ/predicted competence protein
MKTKTLFVIIFLWGIVSLSIILQANPANSNVVIKDIDYLTGDDFVQLHFIIDRMIPIPYVFHPDKNDNTRIVMRMNGVSFQPKKNLFQFESSVIDSIKVLTNAKNTDVDVEIRLKEQVNYRVFTNQKGLYIEFPRVKPISASLSPQEPPPVSSPGQPVNSTPKPQAAANDTDMKKETAADPGTGGGGTGRATGENIDKDSSSIIIKDIEIISKEPDRLKFRVILSGPPPGFNVVPIPEDPVRLAIDFKNTRCKRMNKPVNLLNVKQVRGDYNTPSVFRVVFDLKYLKQYKVSPIMGGKIVEVEFFDNNLDHQAAYTEPPSSAPIDIEVKEKGLLISNTSEIPASIDVDNPPAVPGNGGNHNGNGNTGAAGGITGANGVTVTQDQGTTPMITNVPQNKEDFFGEEKSRIKVEDNGLQESEAGEKSTAEEAQDTSAAKTYSSQVVDEGGKKYKGEPMSFNFHNADLKDVIKIIGKISGLNIILDPGVSGRVTSQLTDVPWDQALELFLKINGLDMVQEGNIVRIGRVQDLEAETLRRLKLSAARAMEGELKLITVTLSFAKAQDVLGILKAQLTPRGEILVDKRSNTLIISDIPSIVAMIDRLIEILDTPNPQVSIEARIVETNANFIESFGIQWGYNFIADAAHGNQTTLKFPNDIQANGNQYKSMASPLVGPLGGYAVNLPASGAMGGTVFSLGNVANTFRLDMAISAMESKGEGRIISAPKTTTQNNMEASIMQGKQIPIQTIQNNTVTVQYRPAALELKVTPQITADGTIINKLEISNNSADFANLVNGIPPITTQSIKTTVMVADGGTIVIGGMYRVEKSSTREGIPFFSKLPLLGALFRNKSKRGEQKELLVFITPRIIK